MEKRKERILPPATPKKLRRAPLRQHLRLLFLLGAIGLLNSTHAATFRVVSYNLAGRGPRSTDNPAQSATPTALIEIIRSARGDLLALQEVRGISELLSLRSSLKAVGLEYPAWEIVSGVDTNIHVAILSRFPITTRRPHTNDVFLLGARRFKVSRGFAEVDVLVNSNYLVTVFNAHLKSRRPVLNADEAEQRLQEARLLRNHIDARRRSNSKAKILVLGDLNDVPESPSTRMVIGQGYGSLIDLAPPEGQVDSVSTAQTLEVPAQPGWTYWYARENTYSRVDYILASETIACDLVVKGTFVAASPDWLEASDHRPVVATFACPE